MKPLGVKEFSEAVGLSPQTVRRLADRGVFQAVRDFHGWRRFAPTEIDRARELLGWRPSLGETGRRAAPRENGNGRG